MKIGINGRFLIAKQTGVQRAAYNLVTTLVRSDRDNEYFIFTGKSEVNCKEWDYSNVRVIGSDIREGSTLRNLLWEQVQLPRLAKKHNIDILHSPANMAPLFYRGKSIIHIHDLCFVVNPEWYSFSFRSWYNFVIPRLARRASKVITNSNNSRNDLLQFCGLKANKVSLVYWAVENSFQSKAKKSVPIACDMKEPYVLYVGSLEPRKNIKTLIKSYKILRNTYSHLKPRLILIGGESPLFADIGLNIEEFNEDIIIKGFVDDDLLKSYYQNASLVAYPSLYEGFGLPPLEAMASGAPVVTSTTSSIPEVVGDAALLVNPLDELQLAQEMARILMDKSLRKNLIERGLKQVQKFSWEKVARNVLSIYYEVYHNSEQAKQAKNHQYIPFEKWQKLPPIESTPSH